MDQDTTARTEPVHVAQLIAGQWRDGRGSTQTRHNPARPDDAVAAVSVATADEVDVAVGAARQALGGWSRATLAERGAVLARAATALEASADRYGRELTREEGKTLAEGVGEVRRAAQILRFFAGEAEREVGELYASPRRGESIAVLRRPRGVVGAITPWNFPIAIPAWKIAPALMYGNCVVWKPASDVPLLAYRLAQALVDSGLPAGVLSLIVGPGAVGQHLATHPGVDAVTFTGSTEVGRRLIAACGPVMTPIQTEMGGKNAAVALADAPADQVARMVFQAAMQSTGQKCTATSRLIVERPLAADLAGELARLASQWTVGDGLDPAVHMGPAVSVAARDGIVGAVEQAVRSGARVLAGGERYDGGPLGDGAFVAPAVLEVDDLTAPVWREEIFGPVLAMTTVDSAEEAFRVANDSPFGLSASVFTNDLRRIAEATETLEVGVLHINSETTGAEPHVPFGGVKQSGFGPHEQGRAAREFFTHAMTVYQRPLSDEH